MSIRAMLRVWDHSKHRSTRLIALLALADWCNDEDIAWPKLASLQKRCRATKRPTQTVLRELVASGECYIHYKTGRQYPNFYLVSVGLNTDEMASRLVDYLAYDADLATRIADLLKTAQIGGDVTDELEATREEQPASFFREVRGTIMKERVLKTAPPKEDPENGVLKTARRGAVLDVKGAEDSTHEPMNRNRNPNNSGGKEVVKINKNELAAELIPWFAEISHLPEPTFETIKKAKAANERWKKPLIAMAELLDFDIERIKTAITWALKTADEDGWGDKVRAPQSVQGTVEGEIAKRKRQEAASNHKAEQFSREADPPRPEPDPLTPEQQARADLWLEVDGILKTTSATSIYTDWLKPLEIKTINDQAVVIQAPSEQAIEWLDNRLRGTIEQAFLFATDGKVTEIAFAT